MAIKPAQYSITVDRARLLVTLRLAGFLTPPLVKRIVGEEQAAVKALGVSSGVHRFLIDVRALDALSLDVISLLQHVTDTVELKPGRFAILVRYGLNSIQTRRMIGDRAIGIFDNEEEALAYLLE